MIEAITPALIESAPNPAPTVLSSKTSKGAGKAPERNNKAKSLADFTVKLPVITPEPPIIADWITGAEITDNGNGNIGIESENIAVADDSENVTISL